MSAHTDAPPPPKTVTVELPEEDARRWADSYTNSKSPLSRRLADACGTALEEQCSDS